MSLLSLVLLLAQAQDPEPFARVRLEPSNDVTVGQPISVVVEVLVPSYFMGAPVFPDLDVDDAVVVFEPRGANFTERAEGGVTLAGQSRRYDIYPQRRGEYVIPTIGVDVRYFGVDGATDASVSSAPVRFRASVPDGAEGLDPFIATTRLTLEESFDVEPVEIFVGDAFTRTLTMTVADALSMVIPPLEFAPIPGLSVYPSPPRATDSGGERGSAVAGTRVEAASYLAREPGHYELPEVALEWWDVAGQRRMRATVAAVEFDVVVDPSAVTEIELPADASTEVVEETPARGRWPLLSFVERYGAVVAGALLVVWLGIRLEHLLAPRLRRARLAREHSESASFVRFRDAALSGDSRATARALMAWLDRRNESSRTALFHDFAREADDPMLEREVSALDGALYGPDPDDVVWSGARLWRRVNKARARRVDEDDAPRLPPLNPSRS